MCNIRQKRHQKNSTVSSEYRPGRTDASSPTPESNDADEAHDIASGSYRSSEKSLDQNAYQKDGQQTAIEVLPNTEDMSGHFHLDLVHDNSEVLEIESEACSAGNRYEDLRAEMSQAVNQNVLNDSPRLDGEAKITSKEMLNMKKENKTVNGHVPSGINEVRLEVCERIDGSNRLASSPKSSVSKTFWKSRRGSLTKSSDLLPKVHTLARVSSVDFHVSVVTYMRSTSNDYSRIDIDDQDDEDEDYSSPYSDISTSWPTSFWTQFTVLLRRTFKQSKPDILSKLNFTQVGMFL